MEGVAKTGSSVGNRVNSAFVETQADRRMQRSKIIVAKEGKRFMTLGRVFINKRRRTLRRRWLINR
jgi:hypothetical protein